MDTWITGYDLSSFEVQRCICAVTVVSPKLYDVLQLIMQRYAQDEKYRILSRTARHTMELCEKCLKRALREASQKAEIPYEKLTHTASIFAIYDFIIIAATQKERVQMWNVAFSLVDFEDKILHNNRTLQLYTLLNKSYEGLPDMNTGDILYALGNKSAELATWADNEFYDEWELGCHSNDYDALDELIAIQVMLEQLEKEIFKIYQEEGGDAASRLLD